MIKVLKRKYPMPDALMLQMCGVKYTHFKEDEASFTSFSKLFSPPFAGDWLNKIRTAQTVVTDEVFYDKLAAHTNELESVVKACKDAYNKLRIFAEKAFTEQPQVLEELGLDAFSRARRHPAFLLNFMRRLQLAAVSYQKQLDEAGFESQSVDELQSLADRLEQISWGREKFSNSQKSVTRERIQLLNELWDTLRLVCKSGKLCFSGDYVKYRNYLLYNGISNPHVLAEELVFEGILEPSSLVKVFDIVYKADRVVLMENQGNTDVSYFLSDDGVNPAAGAKVFTIEAGKEKIVSQDEMGPGGNLLLARNEDALGVGEYLVKTTDE